ncbi:MAG: hypothetical protein ACM3YE_17960, partial [Bacteroidota bacterium]
APILGEHTAKELARDLENHPVILTANHHGVDYFTQSYQGNFTFLLYRRKFAEGSTITPIFACGGIPLSNSSYPKGMLFYDAIQPDSGELPFKQPIFPNNLNQTTVHAAPRFNEDMVESAIRQLEKNLKMERISKTAYETAREILEEEYLDPLVLKQPDYSAQATLLNNRLGKKIFAAKKLLPDLIYIEFETITALLLKKDLFNPDSLVYRIFFDPVLRNAVIKSLNGKKGCWNLEKITGLVKGAVTVNSGAHLLAGYGSIFFWGLDVLGRRYPLAIDDIKGPTPYLIGIDGFGERHKIPFEPLSVLAALDSKLIFPNLFTMFAVVSLARAVTCVGGYFQSDYLPAIQNGLIEALNSIDGYRNYAQAIAGVTTDLYLSGMMFLLAGVNGRFATPAGPIEIISRGGLKDGFLNELGSLSIIAAHQIGLFNIYPDLVSRPERIERWQKSLAFELNRENWKWVLP